MLVIAALLVHHGTIRQLDLSQAPILDSLLYKTPLNVPKSTTVARLKTILAYSIVVIDEHLLRPLYLSCHWSRTTFSRWLGMHWVWVFPFFLGCCVGTFLRQLVRVGTNQHPAVAK